LEFWIYGEKLELRMISSILNRPTATPDYLLGTRSEISANDYLVAAFIAIIVAVTNIVYVADLFMLWHDDNTSYYTATQGEMLNRLGGTVSRHFIIDNILLQIMANVSPFVGRVATIILGAVPMAVLGYFSLRSWFGLSVSASTLGATMPLVVTGQFEVLVGINLSYVVFDIALFYAALLLLVWMERAQTWGVAIIASVGLAVIISDGMVSSILLGPALLICVALGQKIPLLTRLLPAFAVIGASLKTLLEQTGMNRAQWASDPIEAVFTNLPRPVDVLLPGGGVVAWLVVLVLGMTVVYALLHCLRSKSATLLHVIGAAATLYLVPILIYSIGRPGFPNRYAFISVVGVSIAFAIGVHVVGAYLDRKTNQSYFTKGIETPNALMPSTIIVMLAILMLGFQKSQFVDTKFRLISQTSTLVTRYFNPRNDPLSIAGYQPSDYQLLVLSESGFPWMYPHRIPALGWLRFVTGDDRAIGFAGSRQLCADPFEEWEDPWKYGPGGFSMDQPIRVVAFRGENGLGTELHHVLTTEATALDTSDGPQRWSLYEVGEFGARQIVDGAGRSDLEAQLVLLELETSSIALSCGLV
jgi:hypothetical protein